MKQYIIPIVVLLISVLLIMLNISGIIENWQNYKLNPYGYIQTGRDPLYFYRRDRYRRPYEDRFLHYKSYPIQHLSLLE